MNQSEWESATDPLRMLNFVRDKAGGRKLRLFVAGCLRRSWHMLEDGRSRRAVEAAERFADGEVDEAAVEAARHDAFDVRDELWDAHLRDDRVWFAEAAGVAASVPMWISRGLEIAYSEYPLRIPSPAHCGILRDVLGPALFRNVEADPAWRTSTVRALARGIYNERAFERLPVLADALEDAGCGESAVLEHCRGEGPHVRGCWVVDLMLG